jgi:hypothetical protein
VSVLVGYLLLRSGKELNDAGMKTAKATRTHALFALANTRGGVLTPMDVAQAQNLSLEQADAILTSLAKESPDHVSVDIDDHGNVLYRFLSATWSAVEQGGYRTRVGAAPNARVADSVGARERDAESAWLDDEEEESASAQRRAR